MSTALLDDWAWHIRVSPLICGNAIPVREPNEDGDFLSVDQVIAVHEGGHAEQSTNVDKRDSLCVDYDSRQLGGPGGARTPRGLASTRGGTDIERPYFGRSEASVRATRWAGTAE